MKFITSNNLTYVLSTLKTKNDALYAPKDHNHEQYLLLTGGLVTGNVQIDGNLVNNNDATFNKPVTFNDVATLGAGANLAGNAVHINADELVNNAVSTHNNTATFNEDATFNKNVTFGEDAVLNGNKVQIDANTLVNNAVSTHNKAATFNGDATFNSPTTLGAGANLAGNEVQINADALVNNSPSTHNQAATFNGETTFNSSTTLGAGSNLAGNEVQINANTLVNNSSSTHNQTATFNNTVVFNEQTSFSKNLNVTGDVTLSASGSNDSPSLIFYRGSDSDNYTDWRVQDRGGSLYFDIRTGSTTFTNKMTFNENGTISATSFTEGGTALADKYAAKSHGTHLTIGTGASNAAAGNHTHNYAGSSSAGGTANSVNGYTIWAGTKAQYDAITSKSSTTLYFIKE